MDKLLLHLILASAALLTGCSDGDEGRVPAVGHVTIDGAPLGNVYVTFRPDVNEPGKGGFAVADSDGRFEISYPDTGKGLVPARYQVTVAEPPQEGEDTRWPPVRAAKKTKSRFPPIYSSPDNTPLRVVVSADGTPLKVELSSQPANRAKGRS